MEYTPSLELPYIQASQAQKHVTHNEALRRLDAVIQLAVKDRDLAAPPATPVDGDRYIVAANASGAWAGKDGQIAAFQDNVWAFYAPEEGWLAWAQDEDVLLAYSGVIWSEVTSHGGGSSSSLPQDNNLLDNPDFAINQRSFAGGALAEDVYGHDRWHAAPGFPAGADYSVSGETLTFNSGTLEQVLESPGLAGLVVSFSVEDLTGGNLDVDIAGQTGNLAAGSGRKGIQLTIPGSATGDVNVRFSPASGGVSFKRPKLEIGNTASAWYPVDKMRALQKAFHYYYRLNIAGYSEMFTGRSHSATDMRALIHMPVIMRDAPIARWGGDYTKWAVSSGGSFSYVTSVSLWTANEASATLKLITSSLPSKTAMAIRQGSVNTSYIEFDAEL